MKKRKVYIAGKIGAAGVDAMRKYFGEAAARFNLAGWESVNPCDIPYAGSWEGCMIADLKAMLDCDAVYALRNWRSSPGATIEIQLALRLKKIVWFEECNELCQCKTAGVV